MLMSLHHEKQHDFMVKACLHLQKFILIKTGLNTVRNLHIHLKSFTLDLPG